MQESQENYIKENIEEFFNINVKLEVQKLESNDLDHYPSYVKDVTDSHIMIAKPTKGGIGLSLRKESKIELSVIKNDGIWLGRSVVTDIVYDKLGETWITMPEYMRKVQRREFMRLNYSLPIKISHPEEGDNVQVSKFETSNLSAGGLAVLSKEKFQKNDLVKVCFNIEGQEIGTSAKFIHVQYDIKERKYLTGLQFLEIDEKLADSLHKSICKIQIDMRRKGII